MEVQTILFDKAIFTPAQARAWLRAHGHKSAKVHTTAKYHRFRQAPPSRYGFCRTGKPFKKGVRPVYCCPKKRAK